MGNQTVSATAIQVHSRGSLILKVKVLMPDLQSVNISAWDVWFEADNLSGGGIREKLIVDPDDANGLILKLERAQIALLKTSATECALIQEDRISEDLPFVLWNGKINRTGFLNAPDATEG